MAEVEYGPDPQRTHSGTLLGRETPNPDVAEAAAAAEEETAVAAPHAFTVAELKAFAAEHDIDLGEATRKDDIRDKVIEGLPNVASLRAFAADNGIDLHGAQSRRDIEAAIKAGPVDEPMVEAPEAEEAEPEEEEPKGFPSGFGSADI